MIINEVLHCIEKDEFFSIFKHIYGANEADLSYQKERYINAVGKYAKAYPESDNIKIFSAPGRTEIGGNHTDHQHGCVLAASVNLDVIAVVSFHNDGVIRVKSEGYDEFKVTLDSLSIHQEEMGSSSAIVRGICAKFEEQGAKIGGFNVYSTSDVLGGSGISSSAAFETLIGTIIDSEYNENKAGAVEIAKIGQYAENVYFGKNSGLMDQMVCAVGGLVSIDFHNTENPEIMPFQCDFEKLGYCLCITDTKGSHANLTDDYVAIRSEMESVANYFGKSFLRDVDADKFYEELPKIRRVCSDRAVLRAAHFFSENRRAKQEAEALLTGNIEEFLSYVRESGESSASFLQNLYSCAHPLVQAIPLGIMVSKRILGNKGAVRVHGGGFAGTIQAFVPLDMEESYVNEMNRIFGEGSCQKLRIRPVGGIEITKQAGE